MERDERTPGGDFVAPGAGDETGFEELPQPLGHPGLRRWRTPLLTVGVLVAAVVVVLVIVTRLSDTPTAAPEVVTATPSPTAGRTVDLDPTTGRIGQRSAIRLAFLAEISAAELSAARAECPRLAPTCITSGESPTAVLRAVRAAFPHAHRLIVLSDIAYQTTSGRALAYRRISARSGRIRIAVEIRAPAVSDAAREGIRYHDRLVVAYAEARVSGMTVEVQATAPRATPPNLRAVADLAADDRLLATG